MKLRSAVRKAFIYLKKDMHLCLHAEQKKIDRLSVGKKEEKKLYVWQELQNL